MFGLTARRLTIIALSTLLPLSFCAGQTAIARSSSSKIADQRACAGLKIAVADIASAHLQTEGSEKSPTINFEKIKLKNGLEVIFSEDHRLPLVSTNLWYHVGPANEVVGRTGFAHLFEHMMFEGSKHVGPKAHFKYLEGAGASLINGTTDFDRTNYFETLPANQLDLALWLESDRMGFLLETIDSEKLENQRDVVRNERRQSIENVPYGLVEEAQFHELFPQGHPYYASVIGSHADIEAARINDVRDFFKQYYTPTNASLVIVGDFDTKKAKELVQKYFGDIPAGPPVPKIDVQTPTITSRRTVTVQDQVELPRLYMSWLTAPIFKAGDAEAEIAAHILGGGKSSRLYKKLVYEDKMAQDVSASNQNLMLGSVFTIQVTAKPGIKLEQLQKSVNDELDRFRKDGPTATEMEGARNTLESHIISGLERLGGFGGVADRLNLYNFFLNDPGYLPKDLARYDNATAGGVKDVVNKYLTDNACVVVNGVPGKKSIEDVPRSAENLKNEAARKAAGDKTENSVRASSASSSAPTPASQAWRTSAPKAGPEPEMSLPVPVTFKLSNGLTVFLHERHNLPVVSANLTALGGSSTNPVSQPGLSYFTADMLDEGTATRTTLDIAHDIDKNGISVFTGSGQDAAWIGMHSLTKTADPAFELLADIVLHPAFADKEIERVRNDLLTSLSQDKDLPGKIARRVMQRELYGPESALGYEERGTVQSVKSLSRPDLVKFWQQTYVPGNSALAIAGDLNLDQAKALAEKYFGSWQGTAQSVEVSAPKNPSQRKVFIVNKDGAPQTAVSIGLIGISRSNPDYVPTRILNTAFGGMFSSRLNMNLREKHGFTYGVHSRFSYTRSPGPFAIGTSVRTNVTGASLDEIFKELEAVRTTRPISADELKTAKDNNVLSLPGMFETSAAVASSTADLFVYGLPVDYYRILPGLMESTTVNDLGRVAKEYLLPEHMVVSLSGDKAKIVSQIKPLNLGPVELLDYECNPVKAGP